MDTQAKFLKATQDWYHYVNQDHHKDRDCHWTVSIDSVWSYGNGPIREGYRITHRGYVISTDQEFWGMSEEDVMAQATRFIYEYMSSNPRPND